uniref:Photosystem I reaction center subunit IX n=1 Tax=Hyalogonium fusiforme TaxID=2926373 RepID=A0A9E8ADV6_9CHLO|nr:photosystem I reaction center subunit IX [Hyalogonium fusiforme]
MHSNVQVRFGNEFLVKHYGLLSFILTVSSQIH